MKEITQDFENLYQPLSALVIYQSKGLSRETYVEHFDMDDNGNPVNAHPLTVREANALSKSLKTEKEKDNAFLKTKGVLPVNILYINPSEKGSVIWFTKAKRTKFFFTENLGIPNGIAETPALLWKATQYHLKVFALHSHSRPTEKTALYHAPFFNVYENANVCMGTVDVNIKKSACVEEFMESWETYFFNSYFSHLVNGHNPIKGNIVNIWKELIDSEKSFPIEKLKKTNYKLQNLLS